MNAPHATSAPKRRFIKTAAAVAATAAGAPFFAHAKKRIRWNMVMVWQKTLPGLGTGAARLAKRIETLSGGRLEIKLYDGGELVPPLGVFDAVSSGTAQLGHSASYFWIAKTRAAAFFTAVPGGMTANEQNAWIYFGGGQKRWDELYAPFNLVAFPAGNTGAQMGGWFNKKIDSLADIRGLKMRIPGLAGEVFSRLGGSAQTIPPQELYTALQSGVIDALEWVGPWNDVALGFHKAAKYYYAPGFHEGGATLELMANKTAFDALPDDLKQAVKVACAAENSLMYAEFNARNAEYLRILKEKYGMAPKILPREVTDAMFKKSEEVVQSVADDNAQSAAIYRSWNNFRQEARAWAPFGEYGYMQAREHYWNGRAKKKKSK